MEEPLEKCPLCSYGLVQSQTVFDFEREFYSIDCPACGKYQISLEALKLDEGLKKYQDNKYILSGVTRKNFEQGEQTEIKILNLQNLIDSAPVPKNHVESWDLILEYIEKKVSNHSKYFPLHPKNNFPLAFSKDEREFRWFLDKLLEKDFLERDSGHRYRLSLKGLEHLEEIKKQGKELKKEQRQLTAIMFTDIVGYTAIMSSDENKALSILQKIRAILNPLIKKFEGEFLKEIGDGTLSKYKSAVDAVNCAIEIQRIIKKDPEFNIRIGIHAGDVVVSKGDVFGDVVNIASRIEPLAEPGGICITDSVYDAIRNKPHINTIYLGNKRLKNVDHSRKVYAITDEKMGKQNVSRSNHKKKRITFYEYKDITTPPDKDSTIIRFKFSLIDTEFIDMPEQKSKTTHHQIKVEMVYTLQSMWDLLDDRESLIKVLFYHGYKQLKKKIANSLLSDKEEEIVMHTRNSEKQCPYEISRIPDPIGFTDVIDI